MATGTIPLQRLLRILGHPVRRTIMESLWEVGRSFSELNGVVTNHGRLGYHLRSMRAMVERDPHENVYKLTDEGRAAWAWLAQASLGFQGRLDPEAIPRSLQQDITYPLQLYSGDHALLLYAHPDSRRAIAFPFLKAGLIRGNAVIYLASEKGMDRERKEMWKRYFDLEKAEKTGAFTIMSAEEWYISRGNASPNAIMKNLAKLAREKKSQGYNGIQVAAEMDVFFEKSNARQLLNYERKVGRRLQPSMCAMCMYDTHRLKAEQIMSLIKSHGHGIFERVGLRFLRAAHTKRAPANGRPLKLPN